MSNLLSGDGGYQDLLGFNASSIRLEVDDLEVNDSFIIEYADANKNLITDANKKVITIDQDTFTNTDGNVVITQLNRNFDINLNTFSANKNIVSGPSGELTTENKDSFINVANQTTWTESAGRVFQVNLPQDIATNSNVQFTSVKLDKLVGNNNRSELIYEDGVVQKYFYPTVTSGEFNLGKSSNQFKRVYTERLNTYVLVGDTYVSPIISNSGNLGNASFIWNDAHINNINTTNINAIGSTINFTDDVSASNITATNITSTNITATDLKVNNSFNTLDDFKIYQSGSNPTTTQTKFGLGAHGTISTTTNTDDTFTSSTTSIGIASAIGATDLVLSSNPLTSFTATNEFEIINWNSPLLLGFVKNTYTPGTSLTTNPRVFLTIGSGNDRLSYYNSIGTLNTTFLSTSSTIGTTGYKYTFDIDNNKNLTIDKYTPATSGTITTYATFTTGSYTTNGGTLGMYVDVTNPSTNLYKIRSYNNTAVNQRHGWRGDTNFKPEDYSNIEVIFTVNQYSTGSNCFFGFISAGANLNSATNDIRASNTVNVISFLGTQTPDNYQVFYSSASPTLNTLINSNGINLTNANGQQYKCEIASTGIITIYFRTSSSQSWGSAIYTSTGSGSGGNLVPTQEYNIFVFDNNTSASTLFDIDVIGTLTSSTTYVGFDSTGNFTSSLSFPYARYVTISNPSTNLWNVKTYNGGGYNPTTLRFGARTRTADSFRFADYSEVRATFTVNEWSSKNMYLGFLVSGKSIYSNIDMNGTSGYNCYFIDLNGQNTPPDNFNSKNTTSNFVIPLTTNITYPTTAGDKYRIRVATDGSVGIDFYQNSTSTWTNNVQSLTIPNLPTTTDFDVMVWDNNFTNSKADIDVFVEKISPSTPATTQQIFNSATIPTPFTLDNDSYKLVVSDGTSSATQYEVVIDGSISDPGSLETKVELDYLTADKNLILDANNLIKTEDKDTITGTTNQINVNQVGRAFTLSAPQDLHTSANFQVATLNTGQGANELYAMDQDVKTTDDVIFNTINTGQGANELYAMDQDVKTTDDVTFNSIELSPGSQTNPAIFSASEGIFFNPAPKRINFSLNNTESVRITTDAIRSVSDNTYDLGFSGVDFKTLYVKNIENQTKLVLNQLNAWDVVYLDGNKEVKGINLPSEHLLVGNGNSAPTTQLIGSTYELHQNQVSTKFDPVKTSSTITILANGLGIHMNNSGVHRAMCINGITIPNTDYTGVRTQFGFELLEYANNPNLCFGFGLDTLPLDTSVIAGVSGSYSINMHNGKVHEDGVDKGNISGFSYALGDVFEFRIKTNDQFVIYQNGQEIYASTGSITSGTYYPQVFDSNNNTTEFRVLLRPSYRGGQIDTIRVNTDYLTVNSFSYVEGISWSTNLSGRALTLTGNGTPDQIDFILTTSGNDFTQSANGALRYDGEEPKSFNVTYQVSCKPEATAIFTNPRLFSTHIDKNATTLTQSRCVEAFYYQSGNQVSTAMFSSSVVVNLSKNNTISLYLTNHSDTGNAVVPSVKISIMEIPK